MRDRCTYGNPVSVAQALNCACTLARTPFDFTSSAISSPASRKHATTSADVTNPSQPRKRKSHLSVIAAEPAAALGEQVQKADLVGGGPLRQELAEAAVFAGDLLHESGILDRQSVV